MSPALQNGLDRREILLSSMGGVLLGAASKAHAISGEPLADLPMIRLKLPDSSLGREYVAIKLKIQGKGPYDFIVDSGLTTELITPHLQQTLGLKVGGDKVSGLAAGGSTTSSSIVTLEDASLCCGKFVKNEELELPTLQAVITDFPQEHIDPEHDPVEGMIGMELLSFFDVDFDFPRNRLRLYAPGTASEAAKGMVAIPAVVINETGLIGIRIKTTGSTQPVLGFIDCGATFSAINWQAAEILGLPPKDDPSYKKGPAITAVGVDGRPFTLPMVSQQFTFTGDPISDPKTGRLQGFEAPPPKWKPWKTIKIAIGDLPAFSTVLGDGKKPFKGPAALIGLDILSQRRVILETGKGSTRRRQLLVDPE